MSHVDTSEILAHQVYCKKAYMTQRKIIHVDCDCFYAAIEMRDDPRLANKPLAVGGSADKRGVIATCNYEARAYGVRSAMSSRHALKLCPDLTIVKPRMDAYKEASKEIQTLRRMSCAIRVALPEKWLASDTSR